MIAAELQKDCRFGVKKLALLVDPDRQEPASLPDLAALAKDAGVDLFLVGGSLLTRQRLEQTVGLLKEHGEVPVLLFPGSAWQLCDKADALLFLSLISGRNPELLIGQHVQAAPLLRDTRLEVLPTGYMLVDGGAPTTVSYITQTQPLPADKPELAAATALAGKYLGLQWMYLDAGSGARRPVPFDMIRAVREATRLPLFVGGGIRTAEQAVQAVRAGADIVVVGTAIEKDPQGLGALCQAVHSALHLAG
jgi:phosphoglycerol geranylgeranyltransferase